MIQFTCECGRRLQAPETSAGRPVSCPACGQQLLVPAAREDAIQPSSPEQVQVQSKRPPRLSAEDGADAPRDLPAGTSGKAVATLVLGILALFCNVLAAVPAVILGMLALRDIKQSRGRIGGHGLAVAGLAIAGGGTLVSCVLGAMLGLLLPAVQKVREAAARVQSQNNLKQMALAMHSFHDANGHMPAPALSDRTGKPLLSWRVAILPYLGENALYQQFKLDEPWDGPNNSKLLSRMPKVYECAAAPKTPGETIYRVFVGNGAAFEPGRALRITEFLDGTANTILIVEAKQSVPWTKPDDLPYSPVQPLPPLGGHHAGGFNVVAADGAVHFIPKDTPEQTLRPLITRNEGQFVPFPQP
jgi:hypothetical protein